MTRRRGAAFARAGWAVCLAFLTLLATAPPATARTVATARAIGLRVVPSAVVGGAGVYGSPVAGTPVVVRAFSTGVSRYGPGHRGVDLSSSRGADVYAAATGTVTFAGRVAGRGVLVLRHSDGLMTEYEPVSPAVRAGAQVTRGSAIGVLTGQHAGCAGPCLHWGARRGETYLDPMSLLDPLGPVRLLPDP